MSHMWSRALVVLTFVIATQLAGCAAAPEQPPAAPAEPAAPPVEPRDTVTAAAIEAVLDDGHRSPEHRARDAARHPLDTLLFFGITPGMTVAEVWPDSGGWYSEILAPLLAASGMLYVAQRPADPASPYVSNVLSDYQAKLVARPDLYGKVILTTLGASEGGIVPPASCDLVVAIDNLHGWLNLGLAPGAFAAIHGALKPDGIFGVVAHRADPAKPRDPRATNGYVNEQFAIELIEAAGFELVARSELNANPRDTRDYEQGAWALPPDLRQGNRERAKFQAIGEPDRFTLKFRKR